MSDVYDKLCDPIALEQASFEALARTLVELCAHAVAQDERKKVIVAALRTGAERARALEQEIRGEPDTQAAGKGGA